MRFKGKFPCFTSEVLHSFSFAKIQQLILQVKTSALNFEMNLKNLAVSFLPFLAKVQQWILFGSPIQWIFRGEKKSLVNTFLWVGKIPQSTWLGKLHILSARNEKTAATYVQFLRGEGHVNMAIIVSTLAF